MAKILDRVNRILEVLGVSAGSEDIESFATLWPAFQKMAAEGAIVLLKQDGGRNGDASPKPHTVAVSGGKLGEASLPTKSIGGATNTLNENLLSQGFKNYEFYTDSRGHTFKIPYRKNSDGSKSYGPASYLQPDQTKF